MLFSHRCEDNMCSCIHTLICVCIHACGSHILCFCFFDPAKWVNIATSFTYFIIYVYLQTAHHQLFPLRNGSQPLPPQGLQWSHQ